jgi:hypothetical protein
MEHPKRFHDGLAASRATPARHQYLLELHAKSLIAAAAQGCPWP